MDRIPNDSIKIVISDQILFFFMPKVADTRSFDDEMLLYCISPYITQRDVPKTFARKLHLYSVRFAKFQHDMAQMKMIKEMQRKQRKEAMCKQKDARDADNNEAVKNEAEKNELNYFASKLFDLRKYR